MSNAIEDQEAKTIVILPEDIDLEELNLNTMYNDFMRDGKYPADMSQFHEIVKEAFYRGAQSVFVIAEQIGQGDSVADMHAMTKALLDVKNEIAKYFNESLDDEEDDTDE